MVWLISLDVLIPITLVVVILIVLLWILYTKNKQLYQKLVLESTRFHRYKKGIEVLKMVSNTPEKDFESLNSYARSFFKEYLNLDYSLTYLELSEIFKKQNKQDYAEFCRLMSEVNYSGKKKIDVAEIKKLVYLFSDIINKY
ncbi:MAG: hypothetical protein PHH54_05495 [Candidatus Nanoarchaeia archaeon]|nr:hypothetical protein [Candidatus Nanoarchaeia archaeon]MDD5741413.1 hypothetical protein [Candidatus Nanoarchaeia archaeon]